VNHDLRLAVRQHVEALNAEFAYLIDNGLSERVAALFTEDGSYSIRDGHKHLVSKGRPAIAAAYAARAARGARTSCHIFTNLHIAHATQDEARGHCLLLLFAQDGAPPHPAVPLFVARYDDGYARGSDGVWRYRSREVTALFTGQAGHAPVLPLGQAQAS